MDMQLPINFTPPRARRTDPVTSHQAAEKAQRSQAHHEATIYNAICEAGPLGANYKEIAQMANMDPVKVARRLSAMGERKLIERRVKEGAVRGDDWMAREGCAVWFRRV